VGGLPALGGRPCSNVHRTADPRPSRAAAPRQNRSIPIPQAVAVRAGGRRRSERATIAPSAFTRCYPPCHPRTTVLQCRSRTAVRALGPSPFRGRSKQTATHRSATACAIAPTVSRTKGMLLRSYTTVRRAAVPNRLCQDAATQTCRWRPTQPLGGGATLRAPIPHRRLVPVPLSIPSYRKRRRGDTVAEATSTFHYAALVRDLEERLIRLWDTDPSANAELRGSEQPTPDAVPPSDPERGCLAEAVVCIG